MARDALEHHVDEDGQVVFDNLPRRPDGSVDTDRLGGKTYRTRDGRVIAPTPSVPGPDGRPVRPYELED